MKSHLCMFTLDSAFGTLSLSLTRRSHFCWIINTTKGRLRHAEPRFYFCTIQKGMLFTQLAINFTENAKINFASNL